MGPLSEIEFHAYDRGKLSLALLLDVALTYGVGFLEPEHGHSVHNHSKHHDSAS